MGYDSDSSVIRRIAGVVAIMLYELEIFPDETYVCNEFVGLEALIGNHPPELSPEEAYDKAIHPDDREAYDASFGQLLRAVPTELEYRLVGFDGRVRWVWDQMHPVRSDTGLLVTGVVVDITERRRATDELARTEKLAIGRAERQGTLRPIGERILGMLLPEALHETAGAVAAAFACDGVGIWQTTEAGEGLLRAGVGIVASAVTPEGLPQRPGIVAATTERDAPVVVDDLETATTARRDRIARFGARSAIAVPIAGESGVWGFIEALSRDAGHFDTDDVGFLTSVVTTISAAVARDRADAAIRYQGTYDALTGLPNRALLGDCLRLALARGRDEGLQTAALFIDLDNFKDVNDTYGHGLGDRVLVEVAERIQNALRPNDVVARFGGDEFVVVCQAVGDAADVREIALRILRHLGEPLTIRDAGNVTLSASIGIAFGPDLVGPDEALRDADTAMYAAKSAGRGRVEVFDDAMRNRMLARVRKQDDLRVAIERDEFEVHYQPIVELQSGAITAVEALVRWRHPTLGLISPDAFISVAEDTGLITAIGRNVIICATQDAVRWNRGRAGAPPIGVSVNVSPRQLSDAGLVDHLRASLEQSGLPGELLGLEITESILLDDDPGHAGRIEDIKALGIRLLLDDFGTGYSSLAYIQRFPLDALKLDRTFVAGLHETPTTTTTSIVAAVSTLANALSIDLIAEGVETKAQCLALQSLGCRLAQGFLFCRPVLADEISRLVADPVAWTLPKSA